MYKCEACGAPTRPNVDGDIRYDASKPLREIERLRAALEEIASGLSVNDPYTIANRALGRAVTS